MFEAHHPVRRIDQRIPVSDAELFKTGIAQKHVDATQVAGGQIDFLAEKALPHIALVQHLGKNFSGREPEPQAGRITLPNRLRVLLPKSPRVPQGQNTAACT